MQLQFGIFDYIIIAVFYGVAGTLLLLAWLFLRRWRYWPAVIFPLAVVAVVLPWADEIWIAWRFHNLCKDAGVYVYRKVEAEGYLNATGESPFTELPERVDTDKRIVEEFDKDGFRFVEYLLMGGKVLRNERIDVGLRRAVYDRPMARYYYKHSYQPSRNVYEQPMGWGLEKKEQVVVDSQTGEILGRDTHYTRYPSFVTRLWARYFGSAVTGCDGPLDDPEKQKRIGLLYRYVLIPKQ